MRLSGVGATRIFGLSDDLTGALALAAELHGAGLDVTVVRWDDSGPWPDSSVVFDTASRLVAPEVAADRIATVVGREEIPDSVLIFKRIDSAFRGNWSAELAAITASVRRPVVVGVAAPALGVEVQGGHVLRDGLPAGNSDYSEDLEGNASDLTVLLPQPVTLVDRRRLMAGARKLAALLDGQGSVLFDGRSRADLRTVAETALLVPSCIVVGSYGLAREIGSLLVGRPRPGILTVCGSYKEATLRQLRIASDAGWLIADVDRIAPSRVTQELESGRDVVLTSFDLRVTPPSARLPEPAHLLAQKATAIVLASRLTGLVLIGGELSSAIVAELGVYQIDVVLEPWPTIPIVELPLHESRTLICCVKSGAIGEPWWLVQAADTLKALTAKSRLSRFDVDPREESL